MSQFYSNARGILATSQLGGSSSISDSSCFLGADPAIGVAVLKRSLAHAKRPKMLQRSTISGSDDLLTRVNEVDEETEFAPVELFYAKGEVRNVDDLTAIAVDSSEIDEEKVVDLLRDDAGNESGVR